jgi:DNA-binding transcriptional LysR family regulator
MSGINLGHLDLNLLVTFEALMREGNVTRAAEKLGRTQSAISHSLARLRDQVGDPLMIKADGRMSPTPYALKLIDDIRPILRNIQRVVAPPEPFDPATSKRTFRVMFPDHSHAFMSAVFERVQREAPSVITEWLSPTRDSFPVLAAGLIDIAEMGGTTAVDEGIEELHGQPYSFLTYARKDHPAIKDWGVEAWEKWPHIKVKLDNGAPSPIDNVALGSGPKRVVGAWVPNLSSIAPILARSNMLATLPPLVMNEEVLLHYNLCVLEPPVPIAPMPMRFLWSFRLSNDPGSKWFRNIIIEIFTDQQRRAELFNVRMGVIKPKH